MIRLFLVAHTDDDGNCQDQLVFAMTYEQAIELWLSAEGLGASEPQKLAAEDPSGEVTVFKLPLPTGHARTLSWDHRQAKTFRIW